tara:strand:- start:364 stop:576 length:213 start_codon:yes stop_codon:yes gene_type:complete
MGVGEPRSEGEEDPFQHDDASVRAEIAKEIREHDEPKAYLAFLGVTSPKQLDDYEEFAGISEWGGNENPS